MEQNRFKSKILWAAVIAQVVIIADAVGFWGMIGLDKSIALTVAESILGLLVIFGILNDPTNATGF